MLTDATELDPSAWEALRKALNQRVVVGRVRFVPSKVNRVWLVETDVRPVVVKRFLSTRAGIEFEAMLQARKAALNVPFPLWMQENILVSEYIAGDSCDLMVHKMFDAHSVESMGVWLARFHEKMASEGGTRIMGDAVPSNFISSEGAVWGVDLEHIRQGDPLEDVGQLAAAILGNEPYFTPIKYDLCMRLLKSYSDESGRDIVEPAREHVSRHLIMDARKKPLFRRTITAAAKKLRDGWPSLA